MPDLEETDIVVKKKRRTKAEMEALRNPKETQKIEDEEVSLTPAKPIDSVISAISFLSSSGISPGEYSDIYSIFKDCISFKREHNLSDAKFLDLMNCFDERVKKVKSLTKLRI